MIRQNLGVIFTVVFLLALIAAGTWSLGNRPGPVLPTYQIETTLAWSDGPDIELSAQSMKDLNADVAAQVQKEMPGRGLTYPVVSAGKKQVEVMYISDKPGPSKDLQDELNIFIRQRAGELAAEQAKDAR